MLKFMRSGLADCTPHCCCCWLRCTMTCNGCSMSTLALHTLREPSELIKTCYAAFALQLLEYGEGICALLPVPYCCNNAACRSLKCVSELAAIKAGRCSWCKVAHYCSAKCQKDHWARHKAVCKRLKANTSSIQACKDTA